MLFILTGEFEIGKTRWLEAELAYLRANGVPAAGVIAPGIWERTPDGFEKRGIDNVLLPEGRRIRFALRRDLSGDGVPEAAHANETCTKWRIEEDAVNQVNGLFSTLAAQRNDVVAFPSLLVVDELGPLELVRGAGLTQAMALLDMGPSAAYPHALIIVRSSLVECACERFASAWGEHVILQPDDQSGNLLHANLLH